jgi:hypothetical protein
MKKILTTLTVIAATALGAQGQTTNTFPAGTGANSFTGLTFNTFSGNLPGDELYTRARLLLGVTGGDFSAGFPANITISSITLSGQGIATTLSGFSDVNVFNNLSNPADATLYAQSTAVNLNTNVVTWSSATSAVNFTAQASFGGNLPVGAKLFYAVQYMNTNGAQLNTAFGNVDLVAVPEPSTYVAAVGLLGLCLWSARRQLFKFAGARSSASGPGENGAA